MCLCSNVDFFLTDLQPNDYVEVYVEGLTTIDAGDDASNTRLIYETSSRLLRIIRKIDPEFVNSDEIQKLESTARFVTDHYQEAIKRNTYGSKVIDIFLGFYLISTLENGLQTVQVKDGFLGFELIDSKRTASKNPNTDLSLSFEGNKITLD